MLDNHIIELSRNPWMSPAVFVRKKTGDIGLCVDYRELNKRTTHDTYPLPLLARLVSWFINFVSTRSTKQLLAASSKPEKTVFCPDSGMGLFQFLRMPFGLSGAPSFFQRFMDKIFQGLLYVTMIFMYTHQIRKLTKLICLKFSID